MALGPSSGFTVVPSVGCRPQRVRAGPTCSETCVPSEGRVEARSPPSAPGTGPQEAVFTFPGDGSAADGLVSPQGANVRGPHSHSRGF